MRIISGKHKNRKLVSYIKGVDKTLRPTKESVREAVFNILHNLVGSNDLSDLNVADIFCGTGSFGLEALSRGASSAIFLDNSNVNLSLVEKNLTSLEEKENASLFCRDALSLPSVNKAMDIIYVDPPYGFGKTGEVVKRISANGYMNESSILILETGKTANVPLPNNLENIDKRYYGNTKVLFLMLNAA